MDKYISILKIGFQQELAYKLQFIIGRLRNIIQILVFFFLWSSIFQTQDSVFGYTISSIGAYTFLLIIIRSIVMSTKVNDVSGFVSSGELSNYLLKPINFFKYIIIKDIPVKLLNIGFSAVELTLLFIILKPNIYIQSYATQLLFFILSIIIASFIFFCILMLSNSFPFWVPEAGWGAQFLIVAIFVEFLSGAFFPIDVFPTTIQNFLKLTPFPYIVFIPIKTYLGNMTIYNNLQNMAIGLIWCFILFLLLKKIWWKGLKVYEGVGR